MTKLAFLLFVLTAFIIPIASAQIVLPQFNDVYSTGDTIDASFQVMEIEDIAGLVKLNLDCGESNIIIYTSPISLEANELKKISIEKYTFTKEGNCNILAKVEGQNSFLDSAKSSDFLISDALNMSLKFNKESFRPGETLIIKGEAKKANGKNVDGTASIKAGNEGYSVIVKNGAFNFENTLKDNFPSGENVISIEVNDKLGGTGTIEKTISVSAIPTSIEILIKDKTFLPNETMKASAVLYDQSGKVINTAISITLYDSWGVDVIKKIINGSDESLEYTFDKKSPIGGWWIYAYGEGIRMREYISVAEEEGIDVNLNEGMLKVLNTGNIDFKKPLEIFFNNGEISEKKIEELSLGLEGEKLLMLNAPDGDYNVTVKTEDFEKTFSNVYLTGSAISVSDPSNNTFKLVQNIVAMAIIAALAAIAIIVKIKRSNKGIVVGKTYNTSTKKITSRK